MVRYKVVSKYINECGKMVTDYYYRGGRGFTYENAKELVRMLKECGCRAAYYIAYVDDSDE